MSPRSWLLALLALAVALLVQTTALARLPLPGATPDLVLVLVMGLALVRGPLVGSLLGFAAGMLADLGADRELGRTALVLALVGYAVGLAADERGRSLLWSMVVVAGAAVTAVVVYAGEGLLLGDARITGPAFWAALASTVTYSVLLTPVVVPGLRALARRSDDDHLWR
jgi:rod shape-determining protein MreD